MLEGGRCGAAGREVADEGKHLDDDAGVIVEKRLEGAGDRDGTTEFLGELAVEGGGGGFAGFDFAAGKFPEQAEVFVRGALSDKDAAGGVFEHGADDGNRRAVGGWDRIGRGRRRRRGGGDAHGLHGRCGRKRRKKGMPHAEDVEDAETRRARRDVGTREGEGGAGGAADVREKRNV